MSYVPLRQRRIQREIRQSILRRVIDWVGQLLFVALLGTFISFIVLNWLSGCGERFPTDAHGNYVMGECITPAEIWNEYRQSNTVGRQ
jgi:hypothetical protein